MAGAIIVAGYFGLNPPGFAAQVVALAFGLAASSIFPALKMGIFVKRVNNIGACCGMLSGLGITLLYIFWFKGFFFVASTAMAVNIPANHFLGISPEAFGAVAVFGLTASAVCFLVLCLSTWLRRSKTTVKDSKAYLGLLVVSFAVYALWTRHDPLATDSSVALFAVAIALIPFLLLPIAVLRALAPNARGAREPLAACLLLLVAIMITFTVLYATCSDQKRCNFIEKVRNYGIL